jgi:hypothetical protein
MWQNMNKKYFIPKSIPKSILFNLLNLKIDFRGIEFDRTYFRFFVLRPRRPRCSRPSRPTSPPGTCTKPLRLLGGRRPQHTFFANLTGRNMADKAGAPKTGPNNHGFVVDVEKTTPGGTSLRGRGRGRYCPPPPASSNTTRASAPPSRPRHPVIPAAARVPPRPIGKRGALSEIFDNTYHSISSSSSSSSGGGGESGLEDMFVDDRQETARVNCEPLEPPTAAAAAAAAAAVAEAPAAEAPAAQTSVAEVPAPTTTTSAEAKTPAVLTKKTDATAAMPPAAAAKTPSAAKTPAAAAAAAAAATIPGRTVPPAAAVAGPSTSSSNTSGNNNYDITPWAWAVHMREEALRTAGGEAVVQAAAQSAKAYPMRQWQWAAFSAAILRRDCMVQLPTGQGKTSFIR